MNLERHPFVVAACEDLHEGRVHTLPVHDLDPDAATHSDLDPNRNHDVTATFLSLWRNRTPHDRALRTTLLAVMRGIEIEPRHPAYRVTGTGLRNVHQAQVGDDITVVFHSEGGAVVWLAIVHNA